jgi:lipoprotein-anchoring transpeptidase ErfK/SrfK
MSHIKIERLIDYSAGEMPGRDFAVVKRHLSECQQCRKKLKSLKVILAPSTDAFPYPTDDLLPRILRSNKSIDRKYALLIYIRRNLKPLAAAASLLIAVSALFYVFQSDKVPLLASSVNGNAMIDNKKFVKGNKIKSGSSITTGDKTVVSLEGISVRMKAGSRTTLVVKKARIDRETGMVIYDFVVNTGTIDADFDPAKVLRYTLTTPHAIITSTGSKIFVKVDQNKTRLQMKNGTAIVEPNKGSSVQASQGYQYIMSSVDYDLLTPPDQIEESPSYGDDTVQDYSN